ncbi:hypothetical protein Sj15T_39580 [Sphingobium sp. TA15]|uniref:Uncharacterized protein n=1 Tax=Sphingobium indicum (strain DSM 16413 / CCM 7287 / MTCC 6362 / UT26 / NBRC 101211 / UT26S) TaxID=452662 RepID=D4Z736_SPHIU|nr:MULTISPECIES: hypothetical protein [Sphingobium]AMK20290.1 hypothetical protein K663_19658 [Sphingobium sp. MI1205]BAI98894.1 hypothetical protein SJA_C2-05310 [Sphingobium indicum UT26S]BDD68937.1 hypothetical protein Sj15T_39580 [Sphingobium sp. TA15]
MNGRPRRLGLCLLLAAMLLILAAIVGLMVHSSIEAPDPASRTPKGAMPPEGEPMRPAD